MKKIDFSFSEQEIVTLRELAGKKMEIYSHEPFVYAPSVNNVVRFVIEDGQYYLYCYTKPSDYYGSPEDVSVLSFETTLYPFVKKEKLLDTVVDETIQKIIVVNETQRLFERGEQSYDVHLTRGIIFDFGDHQLAFEKCSWMLEEIKVMKGYDLLNCFSPLSDFSERAWADGVSANCSRELFTIT